MLVVVAHRQQQVRQLPLGQLIEHIALILAPLRAPQQPVFSTGRIKVHPRIVAGGDIVVAQRQRPVQQRAEFQLPVAVDAGVGRAACAVLRHEFVHDAAPEPRRLVEHIKAHTQPGGRLPRVLRIVGGAAAAVLVGRQLQHGSVALIALLHQQRGGGRAVHTAGHGYQHLFLFAHSDRSE